MKTINDYAELVKEKHALNKTIAPVETDLTDASRGYHIGEQFIIDGGLFKAKTEIAQHDALVLNTNYEPADNLTEQIKNAGGGTGTDPRLDVFENNIAPVETDETDASRAYQVGEQLILDSILYDVIVPISEHDVITTTGSGANIEPADPLSSQFQTLTNKVSDISDEIADMNNVLGAKNLLPFPYYTTSNTDNGITWTVNSDGSISASGTATANSSFRITQDSDLSIYNNTILSGCPAEGEMWTKWALYLSGTKDGQSITKIDEGSGVLIEDIPAGYSGGLYAKIINGQTVDFTFYPMIRPASIQDDTYVPYSMTNREMTPYVQAISNPNLLDNPWFTVNQRGQSSYTSNNTTIKSVDRWYINSITEAAMNVTDDGVEFPNGMNSFYETLEPELVKKLKGKVVTLSAKFSGTPTNDEFFGIIADGHSWYTPSQCYFKSAVNGIASITFEMPNFTDTNRYHVWMYIQSALTIHAVKLELGTVSTLAMDTAPNYATELLKCQRYFLRVKSDSNNYSVLTMGGYISGANEIRGFIPIPIRMRTRPSITKGGNLRIASGNATLSTNVDTVLVGSMLDTFIMLVISTTDTLTPNTIGNLAANNDASAYIDLSADL